MRRSVTLSLSLAVALGLLVGPAIFGQSSFRRGDANADSQLDLSDPLFTLNGLFLGGPRASCHDAADANDDGTLDISDPVFSLLYLFVGGPEPADPGLGCGPDPTSDGLGCALYLPCERVEGASEFSSPLDGAPGAQGNARDGDVVLGPGEPAPNEPAAPDGGEERLIEESDIYKLAGDKIFVLNRYRGLQIIDLADPDNPRLIGRAPVFGFPREMYVRGTRAYIIVSDYYTFWRDEEAVAPHRFYGSQLRIVDVSDLENPRVLGGINLQGDCSDSRIVGDVMYLVSQRFSWYGGYGTTDTEDKTTILSVTIADPSDVRVVDSVDFPRNGWEHHISVTQEAIHVAASGWVHTAAEYRTTIRYVDIKDPGGTIRVRGEARVPGRVQDRWSMDQHEGVLRVASGQSWGNGDIHITTYSVEDPDHIARLGQYTLRINERLTAARFDGPRGYLVSYRNIDPLFTFDLSDPTDPKLLGELVMSGWLDFIVPMGDRLVALGHEDLVDPDTGRRTVSLAVSLIDVAQQTTPKLLDRAVLDGAWGWVPGDRDDFAKVFKTLPDEGLILFPFQAWNRENYRYAGGVQLIDYDRETLTRRGLIEDATWVERGVSYDEATVLTISSQNFQVIDITDRDDPRVRGSLELARNVQGFALLPGDYAVELSGDWYRGDTRLLVTHADDPNNPEPLAQIRAPSPYGRMFVNGSLVYLVSVHDVLDEEGNFAGRDTRVQVVDLSDPLEPKLRGSVSLPEEIWPSYGWSYWGWGDEVLQVNGSTLAFHRYHYYWRFWEGDGRVGAPVPCCWEDDEQKIYIVNLADPDEPVLASTVVLKDVDWAWGLKASGATLYLSSYRSFLKDDRWMARYYLHRIEVSDPANPAELPPINIPGMFIDASADGRLLYTLESWWDAELRRTVNLFHALILDEDRAFLESSVELKGYVIGVEVKEGAAFAVTQWWENTVIEGGVNRWISQSELVTIDLSDPGEIRIAGSAEIPFDWVCLRKVEENRAFIASSAGMFTYRVEDIEQPAFEAFHRTQGWVQDIVLHGDRAWLPSGFYGVQIIELGEGDLP